MKQFLKYFFTTGILSVLLIFACEEADDCIGCNTNPKLVLSFIPTGTKQLADSLYTEVKTDIDTLVKKLEEDITEEEREEIEAELVILRDDSTYFADQLDLFKKGKILMDSIWGEGIQFIIPYTDTTIISGGFSVPFNPNSDTSTFYFKYYGMIDSLQIKYSRSIFQNFDGVRMKISEMDTIFSTFDSLKYSCTNCTNGKTFNIYF